MQKIQFTVKEQKQMKAVKKQLLTDSTATFSANKRSNDKLAELAKKYNTDTQIIWDSIN